MKIRPVAVVATLAALSAIAALPLVFAEDTDAPRENVTPAFAEAIANIPGKTMTQIALPPMPWMNCRVEPPNTPVHGITLTPDGKKIWITSVSDGGVYVYDIASKRLGKRIAVGECPNWISMSHDGKYAAVSNADSNDTSILDIKSEKEIARIKVGTAPKRLKVIEVPQKQLTEK